MKQLKSQTNCLTILPYNGKLHFYYFVGTTHIHSLFLKMYYLSNSNYYIKI